MEVSVVGVVGVVGVGLLVLILVGRVKLVILQSEILCLFPDEIAGNKLAIGN